MNQPKNSVYTILLVFGVLLIVFGLVTPNIGRLSILNNSNAVYTKPSDVKLLELTNPVITALKDGGSDALALANLYNDIATLIEIDQDVIKNTEEIREANRISGHMLNLGIKDKYPNLGEAANNLVVSYIGDDNAALSPESRKKGVDAFRALAWACNEGSK